MEFNVYKIRKVALDNMAQVVEVGKRCSFFSTPEKLRVGGLYYLKTHQLFRVEAIEGR